MKWFLVLLFWNPEVQDFQVADGWAPLPQPTYERCAERLAFTHRYLPDAAEGYSYLVDCIWTTSQDEAIKKLKE